MRKYLFFFMVFLTVEASSQTPFVTDVSPLNANVGATITITGSNFNTVASKNIVFFGAVATVATSSTATTLTVKVPMAASYDKIGVLDTDSGLSGSGKQYFNPTFSPSKGSITAQDISSKVDFSTGSYPISIGICDLDGDGKPDLAVANNGSNTISLYHNTSSAGVITASSFTGKVDFATGINPYSVAIGDLDGDGKPDLAVANFGSNAVSVLRNTSTLGNINTGSFSAKVDFTTGSAPYSVTIGDLDGDGRPDLTVVNASSSSISVLQNTSTLGNINAGSFSAKVDFGTGSAPYNVAIGDLDGDGKQDLAVGYYTSKTVSVFHNTSSIGSITSGSFAGRVDFPAGKGPYVVMGDLDGDGKPDLALANYFDNTLSVLRNTSFPGTITSGSFAAKVDFTTGSAPISVAIGDVDGDGRPDLATSNFYNTVSILHNTSASGSITADSFATKVDLATGTGPSSIAICDLDGDGRPDLVIPNGNSNTVSILRNDSKIPIRYVRQNATGSGISWEDASGDLQGVIDGSQPGTVIWVAAGIYGPPSGQSFSMKEKVKVYGGFASSGIPIFTDRNWNANVTTLMGNNNTVIANNGNGLTSEAVLDGFSLTGGSAADGGGIYNKNASPTLRNLKIHNNTATGRGAGIYNESSSPLIVNSLFNGNIAGSSGGALYNTSSSSPRLVNVTMIVNKASSAGGMYNYSSSPKICNSIIWGNIKYDSATTTGADIENSGTGITTLRNSITQSYDTGNAADNNLVGIDPLFTNASGGDLSLQSVSPAIGSGDNTFYTDPDNSNLNTDKDLAGNSRLVGTVIDMGAYENQVVQPTPDTNNILYVDLSISGGTGQGSSWANAIPELSDALRWARQKSNFTAANPLKIYVAKGTYKPMYNATSNSLVSNTDRDNAFVMVNNVQLYGGFDPAKGIDDLNDTRIFGGSGSILSGDLGILGTVTDNVYHVVISAAAVGVARLDGFDITGAYANGTSYITVNTRDIYQRNGGGMYNSGSNPILTNLNINSNTIFYSSPFTICGGGGMINSNSNPVMTNVNIYGNTAFSLHYSYGGGIYNSNSSPILTNVNIYNNTVSSSSFSYGGGMYNSGLSPILTNVNIYNNMVSASSSGFGGGIYNGSSSPVLTNVNIYNNTVSAPSSSNGGGMSNVGSSPVLTNVTIANNSAKASSQANSYGGGIRNSSSSLKIYNSIIWGNTKYDNATTAGADIENLGTGITTPRNSITQSYDTGNAADNNLVGINPLFTNASGGDLSLQSVSPARDSGNNTFYIDLDKGNGDLNTDKDLAGNSRVSACTIDMGAYEYQDPESYARWENAAWSNGSGPSQSINVCINDNYDLSASFTSKNLKVTTGNLNIRPGHSVTVYGNITQSADGKVILESDANLLQTEDNANNDTHKVTVKRDVHMRQLDYTYWGSPLKGQKLLNDTALNDGFSVGTPNNRIYNYNEPNDYFVAATDQNLVPGKGYAIRGKNSFDVNNLTASTYQYSGAINNGAYTVDVQRSRNTIISGVEYEHGYNLIGNPYPSNIDFDKFFNLGTNMSKIFGKVWFWTNVAPRLDQSGSGYTGNNYATLTLTGGSPPTTTQPNSGLTPDQFIKVGQGFIVHVRDASTLTSPTVTHQLSFDNSIRTDQGGIFYNARTANTSKDRFWLQLVSPQQFTNTILVGYVNGATNQYDGDYDAEMMSIGDDAVYTLIDAKKMQIDGRQYPLSTEDVIPLGTKYSENGTYEISTANKEGIFNGGQPIYLRDRLLNRTVDISEGAYSFPALKGTDEDRFDIVYKSGSYLDTNTSQNDGPIVYKDKLEFVVKGNKALKQVQLFDMSGRLINVVSKASDTIRVGHQDLPNGTYLLKIYTGDDIVTKKVIK